MLLLQHMLRLPLYCMLPYSFGYSIRSCFHAGVVFMLYACLLSLLVCCLLMLLLPLSVALLHLTATAATAAHCCSCCGAMLLLLQAFWADSAHRQPQSEGWPAQVGGWPEADS